MRPSTGRDLTRRLRRGRLLPSRVPVAILVAPFQFVTAALSTVLGVGVVVTTLLGVEAFTRAQGDLPPLLALAWGVLLFVGGALSLVATLLRDRKPERYEPMESAALVVLGSAWSVMAAAPFFSDGKPSATIIGLLVALACALRVYAISVAARVQREAADLHREVT